MSTQQDSTPDTSRVAAALSKENSNIEASPAVFASLGDIKDPLEPPDSVREQLVKFDELNTRIAVASEALKILRKEREELIATIMSTSPVLRFEHNGLIFEHKAHTRKRRKTKQ